MTTRMKTICLAISMTAALLFGDIAAAANAVSVQVGKSRILKLNGAASVVMIGEPTIADVIVERHGMIFVLGRQAGETNLFILDSEGKTILSTDVVVTPIERRHVNVTRGTEDAALSCNPRCSPVPTTVTGGVVDQNGGPVGAGLVGGGGTIPPAPSTSSPPDEGGE